MDWDVVVIGSGFGGALAAHELVASGLRVLMVERGDWVRRRSDGCASQLVGPLTPYYSMDTPYRMLAGGEGPLAGSFQCVGGASVFYGGVSLRFRVEDFTPPPELVGDSAACWPFRYDDLEPCYARAERLIGVAGEAGADPTEPPRACGYPSSPGALAPVSRRLWEAARDLGLRPFRLPLALNHAREAGRTPCAACPRCDGFACMVGAKNDLATTVVPRLLAAGMTLATGTVAVRLERSGGRVTSLLCIDRRTGATVRHRAKHFVLAAGTLASAHLVLASGLEAVSPAADHVGRYLLRHFNTVVMGVFPSPPDPEGEFHKQVGIHDFYLGSPGGARRLGALQQLATPPAELVKTRVPWFLAPLVPAVVPHLTGLMAMTEDEPRWDNRVAVEPGRTDRFGLPQLVVTHRYTRRDREAGRALAREAARILRHAGAWFSIAHEIGTFSHAVGTLRMGADPRTSVLDADGRFRGTDNLFVSDASSFPTAAAVNPSLTIAANALRVGEAVARAAGRRNLRAREVA